MNTVPATVAPAGNYEETRFNALQHGVPSRYTVLPWEDRSEYETLLAALVAEHVLRGPTEEHLVWFEDPVAELGAPRCDPRAGVRRGLRE